MVTYAFSYGLVKFGRVKDSVDNSAGEAGGGGRVSLDALCQ